MPFSITIQVNEAMAAAAAKGYAPAVATKGDAPSAVTAGKPAAKSRLKRLFEKQFPKLAGGFAGGRDPPEPSTLVLDRMVLNFMEDTSEKSSARCCRRRCNCFNGNCDDSSDDEYFDDLPAPTAAADVIKGLVPCESITERNLLANASKIVESADKSKIVKKKDEFIKIVTEKLRNLGHDASVCKSRWEKTAFIPAGEYHYIEVIVHDDRFILDVDFRSEFEIARSTKNYRSVLQSLPSIFLGKPCRLQKIVAVVSDAARLSLKKKGLHIPPWRKPEYMKAKWLAPHERMTSSDKTDGGEISAVNFSGGFEMHKDPGKITVVVSPWTPPAVKPKSSGSKVVTGLSSVLTE